jgi:hypothetical protein
MVLLLKKGWLCAWKHLAGQSCPCRFSKKYINISREARKVNPKTEKRREKMQEIKRAAAAPEA